MQHIQSHVILAWMPAFAGMTNAYYTKELSELLLNSPSGCGCSGDCDCGSKGWGVSYYELDCTPTRFRVGCAHFFG